eukprot:902020_1
MGSCLGRGEDFENEDGQTPSLLPPSITWKAKKNDINLYVVTYDRDWTFRNVEGTTFYSQQKSFSSWIGLYRKYIDSAPERCIACNKKTDKLVGGHMKRKHKLMDHNNQIIIQICHKCNKYRNDSTTEVNEEEVKPLLK